MEQIMFAKEDAQSVLMVTVARNVNRGFGATPALDAKVRIKWILNYTFQETHIWLKKPL